uniref:Palmitoyltransferase n=1 Tax=Strigamia maritima TaxID=126957 RepID=T1J268_STRMM
MVFMLKAKKLTFQMLDKFCRKTKPPKHPRKNGFSWPPHPIQVLGWIFLITFEIVYVGAVVPSLPSNWILSFHIINGILFIIQLGLEMWVMAINPAHPNLLDNWRSEVAPFERGKFSHVIEDYHCHICDIDVQEDCKHCVHCNKCVASFDHHCIWLNTCIGSRNYRAFFIYICTCFTLLIWLLTVNGLVFVMFFVQKSWLAPFRYTVSGDILTSTFNNTNNTFEFEGGRLMVFVPVEDVAWLLTVSSNILLLILATGLLTYLVQLNIKLTTVFLVLRQTTTYKMILEKKKKDQEGPKHKASLWTSVCNKKASVMPGSLNYPLEKHGFNMTKQKNKQLPIKKIKWQTGIVDSNSCGLFPKHESANKSDKMSEDNKRFSLKKTDDVIQRNGSIKRRESGGDIATLKPQPAALHITRVSTILPPLNFRETNSAKAKRASSADSLQRNANFFKANENQQPQVMLNGEIQSGTVDSDQDEPLFQHRGRHRPTSARSKSRNVRLDNTTYIQPKSPTPSWKYDNPNKNKMIPSPTSPILVKPKNEETQEYVVSSLSTENSPAHFSETSSTESVQNRNIVKPEGEHPPSNNSIKSRTISDRYPLPSLALLDGPVQHSPPQTMRLSTNNYESEHNNVHM